MSDSAGQVIAVLVTYRRQQSLRDHLVALAAQSRPPDRLIVVDNDPNDENRRSVAELAPGAQYVEMSANAGPAGAIAVGQSLALDDADPSDWIVVLDDDNPPWSPVILARLRDHAVVQSQRHGRLGAVAVAGARLDRVGRLRKPSSEEAMNSTCIEVDYVGGGQIPHYSAHALAVAGVARADLFFGYDDLELGLRLRAAGFRVLAHPGLLLESRAITPELRLTRAAAAPAWRQYYTARNGVLVLRSTHHLKQVPSFVVLQGLGAIRLLSRGDKARAVARLRGLWHGVLGRSGRTVQPTT